MTIQCMENGTRVKLPTGETGKVQFTRRERGQVDRDNDRVVTVIKDNTHAVMIKYSQLSEVVDTPPSLLLEDRVENLEIIVKQLIMDSV